MTGLYRSSPHITPDATHLTTTSSASTAQTSTDIQSFSSNSNSGLLVGNARFDHPPLTAFFLVPEGGNMTTGTKPSRKECPGVRDCKTSPHEVRMFYMQNTSRQGNKPPPTHDLQDHGCQKGGRECTYPEVVPSKSSSAHRHRREKPPVSREGSSSLDELEEEDGYDEYLDDDKPTPRLRTSASQGYLRGSQRRESWPSSSDQGRRGKPRKTGSSLDPSPSPRNDNSYYPDSSEPASPAASLRRAASHASLVNFAEWAHLPHDIAFYLNYHRQMLTCHHYLLKSDNSNFFKTTLLELAVGNEALLYAVAAFSSFHYSVHHKTGVFQTFLEYYNKSVGLLRVSLDEEHTMSTILTILQLASFEEYLGDWMNLMEHRNAATKILTALWTPETMSETPQRRMVFNWFAHFDVLVAMMAGHRTTVDSQWTDFNRQAVHREAEANPDNISLKVENASCEFRDLAMDISILTAKRSQGLIIMEDFLIESARLLQACKSWFESLDPIIMSGAEKVLKKASTCVEDDCPFEPATIYKGNKWAVNFLVCDYYGLIIMLKHQIALTNGTGPEVSLQDLAIKICNVLAAVEVYPDAPSGALLAAQAPLGLSALWIPNNKRYRRWIQKQLAKIEQMGFVYPLAFRNRMSEIWNDPQLKHTWITNNTETAIGMSIRQLVDMRDAEFPKDSARHDIKEMRALLTEMRLDSKGSGSLPTPVSESSPDNSDIIPTRGDDQSFHPAVQDIGQQWP
ncbi:unnamed protein product [Tuber aestivum]|uniref:Transcription factor domain-containing protein n=1 Tax=Tuber aestivum TaxID=59557 RepID=A0A292PNP7_9PEZI|nr:unnamed protein product [Tuber aestivum]